MSSGAYYPSFFEISLCLNSNEDVTKGGDGEIFPNLTDNVFSTFFHEYVHYLQNITSLGGVISHLVISIILLKRFKTII